MTAPKDSSGRELARETDRRLFWAAMIGNGLGAGLLGVFLAFLSPVALDPESIERLLILNGAIFVPFMAVTLYAGSRISRRRYEAIEGWLEADRPATAEERDLVLRYPLHTAAAVTGSLWALAAVVFALVNVSTSTDVAITVGVTIVLGGLTSSALAYLIVERILRPVTARAMAIGPPSRAVTPGIAVRLGMAWTLGTAIPMVGVIAVAVAELGGADLFGDDATRVAVTALFLGLTSLAVGLLAILLAGRSVADPVGSVREGVDRIERGDLASRVPVDDGS